MRSRSVDGWQTTFCEIWYKQKYMHAFRGKNKCMKFANDIKSEVRD